MYTLMLWTVIAMAGDHNGIGGRAYDWRPVSKFQSQQLCEEAARSLDVLNRYRCIRTEK